MLAYNCFKLIYENNLKAQGDLQQKFYLYERIKRLSLGGSQHQSVNRFWKEFENMML